ncbi:MAG: methyltransferase domain-containing protein [Bacillota bacterium]
MSHIFDPEKKDKLMSDERRQAFQPENLLQRTGLSPGMNFIDVGCGNGFFAIPAAKIVQEKGQILGFDKSQEMLEDLNRRAKEAGLSNIKSILVDKEGLTEEVRKDLSKFGDMMLFANLLHEVPAPSNFISTYLPLVKDKAKLIIIEWQKRHMEPGPDYQYRLGEKDLQEILAGLNYIPMKMWQLKNHFVIIFEKNIKKINFGT